MPTQQDAQNLVLVARFEAANLMESNRVLMTNGSVPIHENKINRFKLLIRGLSYLTFALQDFTSATFLNIFDCLSNLVGLSGSPTIDPNYQAPNTVINIINEGGAITYTYDQTFLIDAGGGNFYLRYKKPDGSLFTTQIPVQLTINGVSSAFTWDSTFNPSRIYGFANNLTQSIELTVI